MRPRENSIIMQQDSPGGADVEEKSPVLVRFGSGANGVALVRGGKQLTH
jgi:hypothetical protein